MYHISCMRFHLISATDWRLALVALYIVGMGIGIASFSRRYMSGVEGEKKFWLFSASLLAGAIVSTLADQLAILVFAWWIPCLTLPKLVSQIRQDGPARAASQATRKTLLLGSAALSGAFAYGALQSGSLSLATFVSWLTTASQVEKFAVLSLLIFASVAQSGIYPFNRWLVGTASAPTPVSALMHAGIVNGGGILLLRISPAFAASEAIRLFLIIFGLTAAIVSSLAVLASNDFKRGLASSTSTQMAFVLVQIGLGATTAAMIHLILHGTFKALMFLNMANVQQRPNQNSIQNWTSPWVPFVSASLLGIVVWQIPSSVPLMPSILLLSLWIFAPGRWSESIKDSVIKGALLFIALFGIHWLSLTGPNLPEIAHVRPLVDLTLLITTITLSFIKSRPSRRLYLATLNAGQAPL